MIVSKHADFGEERGISAPASTDLFSLWSILGGAEMEGILLAMSYDSDS
jgi:hypothetical protein